MSTTVTTDVAIIGAGIAGLHCAQLLAQHGVKVALVDQRALPLAGPNWINAVPLWMFDEAGLSRPVGKEVFDVNDRFIIRAPEGSARLIIDELGVADVHMGLLGKRLKELFYAQDSTSFFQCAIKACQFENERLVEISGETTDQQTITIRAKLFVDASGFKARLRKSHPRSKTLWPLLAREDTCTAAQRTLDIADRDGAKAYLEREGGQASDVMSLVGFMCGFSLFRVQMDKDLNHVSILCGVRSVPGYPGAAGVINNFVAKNKWIGKAFIDGRGVIPLNAPYHTLAVPGLALLGDAAGQVYAAHGSGIGFGLIGAKLLADAIIESTDGGNGGLRHYQRNFHQRYYHRLYFSEHFRRFSQRLTPTAMANLIASGILGASLARQTLCQSEPTMTWRELRKVINGARRSPKLFLSMLPTLSRSIIGKSHAARLARIKDPGL